MCKMGVRWVSQIARLLGADDKNNSWYKKIEYI